VRIKEIRVRAMACYRDLSRSREPLANLAGNSTMAVPTPPLSWGVCLSSALVLIQSSPGLTLAVSPSPSRRHPQRLEPFSGRPVRSQAPVTLQYPQATGRGPKVGRPPPFHA